MVRLRHQRLAEVARSSFPDPNFAARASKCETNRNQNKQLVTAQLIYGTLTLISNVIVLVLFNLDPPFIVYPVRLPTGVLLWIFYVVSCGLGLSRSAFTAVRLYPMLLCLWTLLISFGWIIIPFRHIRNGNTRVFYSEEAAIVLLTWHVTGFMLNIVALIIAVFFTRKSPARIKSRRKFNAMKPSKLE